MDRFSKVHPLVQILYYVSNMVVVLTINDPLCSAICLFGGMLYLTRLKGKDVFKTIRFLVLLILAVSVFNMLFAHYGEDVLFKIKDVEFTLEALFYGFNQGLMLSAVLLWFEAFSRTVDSEKIIYTFRFAPKLALLFSMVLGFIPRFSKKLVDIREAQLGLAGGNSPKTLKEKIKQAMNNFSALATYSLESSIVTADSMEARGYNPKAVRASRYRIKVSDIVALMLVIAIVSVIVVVKASHNLLFVFEPKIYYESFSVEAIISFCVLQLLPLAISLKEDILWKISSAKM